MICSRSATRLLRGKLLLRTLPALAALCWLDGLPAQAALTVSELRCESRAEPLGVDARQPRLSWELASSERGQTQTAYRVLVASNEKSLAAGIGDLWDSGKVQDDETVGIAYRGTPLLSGQRCFWEVQTWDQADHPSRWSHPTWWEMGLLHPADWTGLWLNDGKLNPTNDADFYADDPAPLFRREVKLTKPVRRARLCVSGLWASAGRGRFPAGCARRSAPSC